MKPDDELSALWYHLEDMCQKVEAPRCYVCKDKMTLVPPELLYHSCRRCFSTDYLWQPVEVNDGTQED